VDTHRKLTLCVQHCEGVELRAPQTPQKTPLPSMGGVVVVRKRPHGAIKMLNLSTTHSISIPIPPNHQSNNPVRPLRKRLWFVDNRKSKNCWQHDDGDDSVGWLAAMIQPIGMFRRGKGKRGPGDMTLDAGHFLPALQRRFIGNQRISMVFYLTMFYLSSPNIWRRCMFVCPK